MYNLYVSINGDDLNSGTFESPFATIGRAQLAVRKLIKNGLDSSVKVTVLEGEYATKGMVFDSYDSGTSEYPIRYEAQGEVILNSGIFLKAEDLFP